MKRAVCALAGLGLALSAPAAAQVNDDDYTPLGSHIKRDRQFPQELPPRFFTDAQRSKVNRERSKAMMGQFTKCLFNRSNEQSLALLQKTDFGFADFAQIDLDTNRALRVYGFNDCLGRVANTHGTGVTLRFSAGAMRQWLLQEAYFSRFPEGPTWVQPGAEIAPRVYPLSEQNAGVGVAMDFADCVVQSDPFSADFFFRVPAGSPEEKAATDGLMPALGPCLPQGQQIGLSPQVLRVWLGEALWHAANNSTPAAAATESAH